MKPLLLFSLVCSLLGGCARYTLTQEDIISRHSKVQIIRTGNAQGPYIEINGFVGNPDMPISVSWNTPNGLVKVDSKAEKGYYFAVDAYANKEKEVFWILYKLPNQK